ncbi:chemotaxis-specific protein-glutamate methyltransferase CheB [Novosphingobium sp. PhB165]|uniref:chemotaxis-specific protein-glutamate methyltransferase CheB n=1 Tax=Novosphingobium sp. PhB165 TaxID=2485105 RepID=UPI001FB56CB0|nr:chemotaxis-specific protein-glutamate methyltransferase CheB [Novosphingobium sp. PhB165]
MRSDRARAALLPPVRLMIIDDSLVARTALKRMVEGAEGLEVVGIASNAEAALETLRTSRVDVVLLDLDMPGMGGLEALPRIIERARGARILVVSSLTIDGAEHTLAALALGAADTLPKPVARGFHGDYRDLLLGKIRELGLAAVPTREAVGREPAPSPRLRPPTGNPARQPAEILAIGASTGGVHALASLFAALPRQLGVPVVITQHLPPAIIPYFARQIRSASGCETLLAEEDMPVLPDRVLIAPGDAHMAFRRRGDTLTVRLDHAPAPSGCLPSLDTMFASLAEEMGDRTLGVVLSGMGRDGALGAARIVAAGGTILAQDEASSAVWGMPRAVAEAGLASAVLPPEQLAQRVIAGIGGTPCK